MNVDKHEKIRWVKNLGHMLLMNYEIEIGGTSINKEYGKWLEIWMSLQKEETKKINEEIIIEI